MSKLSQVATVPPLEKPPVFMSAPESALSIDFDHYSRSQVPNSTRTRLNADGVESGWVSDVLVTGAGVLNRPGWYFPTAGWEVDFLLKIDGVEVWELNGCTTAPSNNFYLPTGSKELPGDIPFDKSFELLSKATLVGSGTLNLYAIFPYRVN